MISKLTGDLYSSFKGAIEERIASPLISSFSISWLLVNFKVILFVFNNENVNTKVGWINFYFSTTSLWLLVYLPLVTSLIYIFIYPFVANFITRFLTDRKLELHQYMVSAEGRQLVSEDRLARIQLRHSNEKKELKERILELDSIIDELTVKLSSYENKEPKQVSASEDVTIDADRNTVPDLSLPPEVFNKVESYDALFGSVFELEHEHFVLLAALGYSENLGKDFIFDKDLFKLAKLSIVKGRHLLQTLIGKKWITTAPLAGGTRVYLTETGRAISSELLG